MSHLESTNTWKSQSGYIWSLIGSAVGFANLLSFSAQVYKNGGGAFLIPYFFALFALGIPMLFLEGLIGYKWKLPLVTSYGHVLGKAGKLLGWLAVFACITIGGFYIVLTGYSFAYTYFSAIGTIPADSKTFFLQTFLRASPSLHEFGTFSTSIFLATLAVGIATWLVLVRNVKDGIEKICTIFMPLMALIIAAFAVIVCLLPGGINGLWYYLTPNFSRLNDVSLWRDIFGQLFFSLSLGLGIIVGYSRHTKQSMNVGRAMVYVALGDFAVSFISGLAIFGCLAHIEHLTGTPFSQLLNTESTFEIGFILFPQMLQVFGQTASQFLGTLFFFCVFVAGITGVFSIVESIAGNFEIEFNASRKNAVTATLACMLLFSVAFCMGNGTHLIDALVPMVIGTNMLLGGLALVIVFYYGSSQIRDDALWIKGNRLTFYGFCMRYVAPLVLAIILLGNLWQEFAEPLTLAKTIRWIWFAVALIGASLLIQFSKEAARVKSYA